jgi:Na+/melibiose symporter-like transporter
MQDAYFISRIGRRKTWVLGTLICLTVIWGLLSFEIRAMVDNLEVPLLATAGIITSLFLTSQDVSMDGLKS